MGENSDKVFFAKSAMSKVTTLFDFLLLMTFLLTGEI